MIGEPFTTRDESMLASHGLSLADAHDAQLRWVTDEEGAEIVGQKRTAYRDFSGILFQYLRDGRVIGHQLRLNNPALEEQSDGSEPKEKNKYLFPPGERGHLYFAPTAKPEWFDDPTIDLLMTEGGWKTLAGHRLAFEDNPTDRPRFLAVGLGGVWNFRGRTGKSSNAAGKRVDLHGPIPDLNLIRWVGRRVKIVFDSDVKTNSAVRQARRKLAAELIQRGAVVEFIDVPGSSDGSKQGLDDWLGAVGAKRVLEALAHGKLFDISADNVLAIIRELPEKPTFNEVGDALSNTAQIIAGADKLTAMLVREGCVRALKDRGFTAPTKLVDAALCTEASEPTDSSSDLFLADPEPWPEPVNGTELLSEMVTALKRFVSAEITTYRTAALWVLFTYAFECFYCLPILLITAATKRAGKSTLLTVLGELVCRAMSASNLTEAVLYRVIEAYTPTLLLDECDTFLRDNEALRGVINSGHTRASARVLRCVGDSHEVESFSTFAPKALAGIGKQADTITDRSIKIRLKRATAAQRREHLRLDRLSEMEPLRAKAARWALDNAEALRLADPNLPTEMTNDRARDNWRTLLAVADAVGGEWPEWAREAALALSESDDSQSVGELLIADLYDLFYDPELGGERHESSKVVNYLVGLETRPWAEWGRQQKPITTIGVARLLRDHEIKPTQWREGDEVLRGYLRADFQDAFDRYCRDTIQPEEGNRVGTPGTPPEMNRLQESKSVQNDNSVPTLFDSNSLETKGRTECTASDTLPDAIVDAPDPVGQQDAEERIW